METVFSIFMTIFFFLFLGWLFNKAMGSPKIERKKDTNEELRKKYLMSISTNNPIKWTKYTIIINSANKKFINIYNFHTPIEYKQDESIFLLAHTVLFEQSRQEQILPQGFIELLVGLHENNLAKYIKPFNNTDFDFDLYEKMYITYNDFRTREIKPIISMIATLSNMKSTITIDEIDKLSEEYNKNPMFGRELF